MINITYFRFVTTEVKRVELAGIKHLKGNSRLVCSFVGLGLNTATFVYILNHNICLFTLNFTTPVFISFNKQGLKISFGFGWL